MLDRLKDQIGRRQDELIGLTRDLVAFPTVNPPGEAYMECAEHLGERLRRRGFEVDEAGDGSEGLARVEAVEGDYQVVLLDLSMPGISGERVLERLKQDHPSLPVVMLSGFVEDPAKVAAADAVLNKPLTTRALVATLDRVLGASSSPG